MSYSEETGIVELVSKLIRLDAKLGNLSRHDRIEAGFGSVKTVISVYEKQRLEQDKTDVIYEYYKSIIELDRVYIRKTPDKYISINLLREVILDSINIDDFFKDFREEIFEYHQDNDLLDRATFICNYYTLKPPYVRPDIDIPDNIKKIYHESRWCFVFCQYNASVALSRTIIETILQHRMKDQRSIKDLIDSARDRNIISQKMHWKLNKVRINANKILHKANTLTRKDSLLTLDYVLDFIEEIYFN